MRIRRGVLTFMASGSPEGEGDSQGQDRSNSRDVEALARLRLRIVRNRQISLIRFWRGIEVAIRAAML